MKKITAILFASVLLASCSFTKSPVVGWNYHNIKNNGFAVVDAKEIPENYEASNRKISYKADIRIRVENTDSANNILSGIASVHGGYIMTLGRYRSVIKVKSAHIHDAMKLISTLGKQIESHVEGEDVTDEYHDLGIRLENAQKKRQNYLKLLEKAHTLDMAIKLEKELERVNNEIDRMMGRINQLEDMVVYSTITVNWHGKIKPGVFSYAGIGIYEAVKWLFVRG